MNKTTLILCLPLVDLISLLSSGIPYIGPYMQAPFSEYLARQREKLHRKPGGDSIQVRVYTVWLCMCTCARGTCTDALLVWIPAPKLSSEGKDVKTIKLYRVYCKVPCLSRAVFARTLMPSTESSRACFPRLWCLIMQDNKCLRL